MDASTGRPYLALAPFGAATEEFMESGPPSPRMDVVFAWLRAHHRQKDAWYYLAWAFMLLPFVAWAYVMWFVPEYGGWNWALWGAGLAGTLFMLRAYLPLPRRVRDRLDQLAGLPWTRRSRGRVPRHGHAAGERALPHAALPDPGSDPDPLLDVYDAASRTGRWR